MIRFPSRPHRSQIGLVALAALIALGVAGCPEKHIGRRCTISNDGGTADGTMPTELSVNPLALECPSRICIKPAQQLTTDTQALCTDECSGDDDCADGEKRDPKDPTDKRCQTGFVCRTLIPDLANVPFSCKKICACKDFLLSSSTDMKPASCP
jgi:hypothetical protein